MLPFKDILLSQPSKYYEKVDTKTAISLQACFKRLEDNPFYDPSRIKKLKGKKGLFRYAVGGLRVVYEIDIESRAVGVLAIFPRGDIYKRF